MPHKDPIKRKEYARAYYLEHRSQPTRFDGPWSRNDGPLRNKTRREWVRARTRNDEEFREYCRQKSRESYLKCRDRRLALAKKHQGTEATIARQFLRNALRRKELNKANFCDDCGKRNSHIQGHHENYSKPLEVIWLCPLCHGKRHQIT